MPHDGHAWQWLYPPRQCFAQGRLDVGHGHALYWETSGHPLGAPALFLHGGPGAGCTADDRRWFDPAHYRIVLFDQRGCGRSRPRGECHANTTAHMVADIEALRRHLHIQQWALLFGGSWGSTLALAYAQAHPDRVRAMVLRGVFLATACEREWLFSPHGAAARHPHAAAPWLAPIPPAERDDMALAYDARLATASGSARLDLARAWTAWEDALMACEDDAHGHVHADAHAATAAANDSAWPAARLGAHYARHGYFLDDGALLAGMPRLAGVAGVIVQGLQDAVTPPAAAQALHEAWPGSALHLVPHAGHASGHPLMARRLVDATDALRSLG